MSSQRTVQEQNIKSFPDTNSVRDVRIKLADTLRKQKKEENMKKRRKKRSQTSEQVYSEEQMNEDMEKIFKSDGFLEKMTSYLQIHSNYEDQLAAICFFKRISEYTNRPSIQHLVELQDGIILRNIANLLLHENTSNQIKSECAWVFCNMAAHEIDFCPVLFELGIVNFFLSYIKEKSFHNELMDACIWGLGNIILESNDYKNYCLEKDLWINILNIIGSLIHQFNNYETPDSYIMHESIWVISIIVSYMSKDINNSIIHDLLVLSAERINLLFMKDIETETVIYCLSTIFDLCKTQDDTLLELIFDSGSISKIIELLENDYEPIHQPCIRIIGEYVANKNPKYTYLICELSPFKSFYRLLHSGSENIRLQIIWVISNVAATGKEQIQILLNQDMYPPIIAMALHEKNDIKKEACWVICNTLCKCEYAQVRFLVSDGMIKALCFMIQSKVLEVDLIKAIIESFDTILRESLKRDAKGGMYNYIKDLMETYNVLQILDTLQDHPDEEVSMNAKSFLEDVIENPPIEVPEPDEYGIKISNSIQNVCKGVQFGNLSKSPKQNQGVMTFDF